MTRLVAHVSAGSRDMQKSAAFYDAVLKPLGAIRAMDYMPYAVGYGPEKDKAEFWVQLPNDQKTATAGNGVHFCFAAATRNAVDEFYKAALKNGGKDAGPPGLRPDYAATYYAAFVYDPDGNKLEAVTFAP
jgi:catechol 2,3-dioxygenase-like lactoylglutathione lyase family enzyme